MSQIMYHKVQRGDQATLTIFTDQGAPVVVTNDHPYFAEILDGCESGDSTVEDLRELADLTVAVANNLTYLSERIGVVGGEVYFDGDKLDNALTQQIVRLLDAGDSEGWGGLALFMEKLAANPSEHSRTQLYDWLRDRDFTITGEGLLVGYKGVEDDGKGGYRSLHAGGAIVNGVQVDGYVPNAEGDLIEIARSKVQEDSAVGCSTGLHVGTYEYAKGYAHRGVLLKVLVNPRDVVSVPTDCNAEKLRCCRYEVVEVIDTEAGKITEPVIFDQAKHTAVAFD